MIDHLEQLKKARLSGVAFPSLVEDTDLTSAFRLLDPVGKGFITYSQYASSTLAVLRMSINLAPFLAMESLGARDYEQSPAGKDEDRISLETFCNEA